MAATAASGGITIVAAQKITDFKFLKESDKSVIVEIKAGIDLHTGAWTLIPATLIYYRTWTGKEIVQMFCNGGEVTRYWDYATLAASAVDGYWIDDVNQRLYVLLYSSCPAVVDLDNGDMAAWTFLTNTPYYWYTMDNIAGAALVDEEAHTNGTISGATAIAGIIGNCLDFDGINDFVDLEWEVAAKPYFTMSFWLKINTWSSGKYIFGQLDAGGDGVRIYQGNTNSIALSVTNATGVTKTTASAVNINDGAWHHIIAMYTGGIIAIKVDHTWSTSTVQTGNTKTTGIHAFLGACNHNGVTDNFSDCCIDQFRYFNAISGINEQQRLLEEPQMPDGCPDDRTSIVNHSATATLHENAGKLRFTIGVDATNCNAIYSSKMTLKVNQQYRLIFDYQMSLAGKLAQYEVHIFSGGTHLYLQADGSFSTISHSFDIANALGVTSFSIYFTTHISYTDYYLLIRNKPLVSASCWIDFDNFQYEEICSPQVIELLGLTWLGFINNQDRDNIAGFIPPGATREIYYEPLLNTSSIPSLTQKIDDYYRSALTISFGDIVFLNNGYWWAIRQLFDFHNKEIVTKIGEDNCDYDEYVPVYRGVTKTPVYSDDNVTIGMRDARKADLRSDRKSVV